MSKGGIELRFAGMALRSGEMALLPIRIILRFHGTALHISVSVSSKIVQSLDNASKASELSDYSACVTALIHGDAVYILGVFRGRLEYPNLKKKVLALKEKCKADTVLIEDKASGQNLIQDLRHDQLYTKAIEPDADKVKGIAACNAMIETGAVHEPQAAP